MDWLRLTNAELLAYSGQALAELRRRGIVRTANAPAGDLAERLVADAMRGELAPNSQKSWDVLAPPVVPSPWRRIQVKARVVTDGDNAGQRQVSAFRSWDFDAAMFVLFDPVYAVRKAALVAVAEVQHVATHVDFTASDRVFATDALLRLGGIMDRAVTGCGALEHDRPNDGVAAGRGLATTYRVAASPTGVKSKWSGADTAAMAQTFSVYVIELADGAGRRVNPDKPVRLRRANGSHARAPIHPAHERPQDRLQAGHQARYSSAAAAVRIVEPALQL